MVVVHSAEAGVSSQKWILTYDGCIELDSHDLYVLGSSELKDGAVVLLGSSHISSTVKSIQWKFSVPVFGKTSTTTTGAKVSTVTSITKAIENGAKIESTQEVASVKKSDLSLARKTTKSSYIIYRESRLIISWWKIIFMRRLSTCRTQKEYLEVIEQYRQILYSRFAQYISVYGSSVSKKECRLLEQSIEETEDTLETEVFDKCTTYLNNLKSDDIVSVDKINVSDIVSKTCGALDKKFETIISTTEKESTSDKESSGQVVVQKKPEHEVDNVLVTVDTIQITIRYWLRTLYIRISEASKNGAKPEEIQKLIKDSHQEVQAELKKLNETASTTLTESTLTESSKKEFEKSLVTVMEKSTTELDHFVSNIEKSTTVVSVENWKKLTNEVENKLSVNIHDCKDVIHKYDVISEDEIKKEQDMESVDEEDVQSSKIEIVSTLTESKTYISTWFANVLKDISWSINNETATDYKKDTLTIIDAAELDVISRIDESAALISVLSSSLTYLSWSERRYLITYYIGMKSYLLTNIERVRCSVVESTDKDTTLKICDSIFGVDGQTDIVKNIDQMLEKVTTTTTSSTIVVVNEEGKSSVVEVEGSKTEILNDNSVSVASGVVTDDSKTSATIVIADEASKLSKVDVINKDSQSVKIDIIADDKKTISNIDEINTGSSSITVGAITKGETTTLETIVNDKGSVTAGKIDTAKDQASAVPDTVIGGIVAGGIITGVVSDKNGTEKATVGVITEEDTITKVDVVKKDSETIIVDEKETETLIVGEKETETKVDITTKDSEVVSVDKKDTYEKVDTEVEGTEKVTVGVITTEKDTESKVEVITKDSESVIVGVIADDKKTVTEIDETENITVGVISGQKETITEIDSVISGGVVAGGIIAGSIIEDKETIIDVDVVTKDSEKITVGIVTEEKDACSKVDVITEESEKVTIGVITDDKTATKTDSKKNGAIVGGVIAGGIIAGVISGVVSDKKDTECDVITKDTEKVTVGVITEEDTITKVDVVKKDSETIIVDEKEAETIVDFTSEDTGKVTVGAINEKFESVTEVNDVKKDVATELAIINKEPGIISGGIIVADTNTGTDVAGIIAGDIVTKVEDKKDTIATEVETKKETTVTKVEDKKQAEIVVVTKDQLTCKY
ncbi:hypothetical protein HPULCUR_003230 [Helicostylum pulchrum]|uniref:Uncharacterized protein n=1 Tax=Helicostylum pulchrum TaxID=562976 RepID=A0ABP9XSS9_9FUNG